MALWLLLACLSAGALEPLTDAGLADTVAQAGLSIYTNLVVSANATGGNGAALSYTDTNPQSPLNTAKADLNLRNFGLTGSFLTTLDAGTNSGGSGTLLVSTSPTSAIKLSFNSAWPSSAAPVGMGVGILDICNSPGSGAACTPGSSNDYPLLMAPRCGVSAACGVTMTLTSTGLQFRLGLGSGQPYFGLLSDTAAASFTLGGTGNVVNLALVDPGSTTGTVGTQVGGLGLHTLTVNNLEFGQSSTPGNDTTFDFCTSNATTSCPLAKTGGGAGFLFNIGSSAMSDVSVVASGVTLGNVGSSSANNGVGSLTLAHFTMANSAILISGH